VAEKVGNMGQSGETSLNAIIKLADPNFRGILKISDSTISLPIELYLASTLYYFIINKKYVLWNEVSRIAEL